MIAVEQWRAAIGCRIDRGRRLSCKPVAKKPLSLMLCLFMIACFQTRSLLNENGTVLLSTVYDYCTGYSTVHASSVQEKDNWSNFNKTQSPSVLLVSCGDVERNPGPLRGEINAPVSVDDPTKTAKRPRTMALKLQRICVDDYVHVSSGGEESDCLLLLDTPPKAKRQRTVIGRPEEDILNGANFSQLVHTPSKATPFRLHRAELADARDDITTSSSDQDEFVAFNCRRRVSTPDKKGKQPRRHGRFSIRRSVLSRMPNFTLSMCNDSEKFRVTSSSEDEEDTRDLFTARKLSWDLMQKNRRRDGSCSSSAAKPRTEAPDYDSSSSDEETPVKETIAEKKRRTSLTSLKCKKQYPPGRRFYRACPVVGCPHFGQPYKKLAQHLQIFHSHLSRRERRILLRKTPRVPADQVAQYKKDKTPCSRCPSRTTTLPGTVTLTSLWSVNKSSQTLQPSSSDTEAEMVLSESEEEMALDAAVIPSETESTDNPTDAEEEEDVIDEGVIVRSDRKPKQGSTASYTLFDLDRTRSLKMFQSYLKGLDGGKRGPELTRWHAAKLSKFLYFASRSTHVNWMAIKDADKIESYLEKLSADGLNVGGQLEVLGSIRHGIDFCLLQGEMLESVKIELTTMDKRLKNWMKVMRKEKHGEQLRREEELCETPPDISSVKTVMASSVCKIFDRLADCGSGLSVSDQDTLVAYLLCVLIYGNAQRPAAVLNATLEDYQRRREITDEDETFVLIKVTKHKTFKTHGPANLVMSLCHASILEKYVNKVRLAAEGETLLLLNSVGLGVKNYSYYMKKLGRYLGLETMPTATDVRRAVATCAAMCGTQETVETVSKHIGHLPETSFRYYRLFKGTIQHIKAHRAIAAAPEQLNNRNSQGSSSQATELIEEQQMTEIKHQNSQETPKKHKLSDNESEELQQHFSHKKPTMKECREYLSTKSWGMTAKQLQDKIRYLLKKAE